VRQDADSPASTNRLADTTTSASATTGGAGRARGRRAAREHDDERRPDQVAREQHPLPAPPVEEHARERSDDAVGEQQRREAGGRLAAEVARSGLKKTAENSAAWNSPSAN
jgi:hypothetical protein